MTIAEFLAQTTQQLRDAGIASARLDTELLLADQTQQPRSWLLAHDDARLTIAQQNRLECNVARRLTREPMAYIRGFQEFYNREFLVNPHVLIPRPDSEAVIELFLQLPRTGSGRLLDVGTGSGALAITAKLEAPEMTVEGVDVSAPACKVAMQNAAKLGANVQFTRQDLLAGITVPTYTFILANLPYVSPRWRRSPETDFEPSLALFAEDDGLALIKKLIIQATGALHPSGYLLLEADPRQHQAIIDFAATHHFSHQKTLGFAISLQLQLV